MSTWITLAIIAAIIYAFTAAVIAFLGLLDYSVAREYGQGARYRQKAARQIKYAIIWPALIPKSALGHFFKDLRRDMQGGKK